MGAQCVVLYAAYMLLNKFSCKVSTLMLYFSTLMVCNVQLTKINDNLNVKGLAVGYSMK